MRAPYPNSYLAAREDDTTSKRTGVGAKA